MSRFLFTLTLFITMYGHAETAQPESPVQLEDVIVSASLTEQPKTNTPTFSHIIYANEIMANPATSLAEIIAQQSNIHNHTFSSGRDGLQVRGMPAGYTLVLVNGLRVSSSSALWRGSDFDYSSIPLNSIARIEVIRGPASTIYGSDAMGGVVNIITKDTTDSWYNQINLQYKYMPSDGGKNQWTVAGTTSGALTDTLSLRISADKAQRDIWYDDSAKIKVVPAFEEKRTGNINADLRWQVAARQYINISAGYNNDHRPKHIFSVDRGIKQQSLEQKINRHTAGLNYHADWNWGTSALLFKYENSEIDDFNTRYQTNKKRTLKERNLYTKFYATTDIAANQILAGVEARQQKVEDQVTYAHDSGSLNETALFAQNQIKLFDNLSLTLGGRYDYNQQYKGYFSPKVYIVSSLSGINLKAGVSQAFKAPKLHQSSKDYQILSCGGRCFLRGNPDLKPEVSTNYELGVDMMKPKFNLSTAIFHNRIQDMIVADYNPITRKRVWSNLDQVEITGLEMDLAWKFTQNWQIKTSFTHLVNAERTDKSGKKSPIPSVVNDIAQLALKWQIQSFWQTQLNISHTGEEYDVRTKHNLKSYQTLDWGNAFHLNSNTKISAGVTNISDVRLPKVDNKYTRFIAGRRIYATLNYEF